MKLYIEITSSMYLASSICLLFILLMQLVNGAQALIIIFFLLLGAASVPVFGMVTVPFTSMYTLL